MVTDEQKPNRRYLLLVAATVLSVLGWWWAHRGVIDPRLVGRWENVIADGLPGDMTFGADGSASYIAAYLSFPVYNQTARWCVQDGELVLTSTSNFDWRINWQALRHNVDLVWNSIGGAPDGIRMRIVEVRDQQLELELDHPWGRDDGPVVKFRRTSTPRRGP